jgi:hypothetical protein
VDSWVEDKQQNCSETKLFDFKMSECHQHEIKMEVCDPIFQVRKWIEQGYQEGH